MANMSYCRFQNTMMDFRDCLDIVGEAVDDGKTMEQFLAELSKEEQYAFCLLYTSPSPRD